MNRVAMTFLAMKAEPSQLEGRAHAIKNCISVILGLASTLERHVDPVARPRVAQLVDTSRRLRDLLTRSAKPCALVREDLRISDVVRLVADRLGPQADACDVDLAIDCAGGALLGDPGELAEALYNLGSNALHASPRGSTVRITTRTHADGDHEWRVEDTGCGISASLLPRLGTVGPTTRDEGTGLGFSLALQAITRHEGVMRIESGEGCGTTVTIWLPASPAGKP
jgi:signal transduction histidine kinase